MLLAGISSVPLMLVPIIGWIYAGWAWTGFINGSVCAESMAEGNWTKPVGFWGDLAILNAAENSCSISWWLGLGNIKMFGDVP